MKCITAILLPAFVLAAAITPTATSAQSGYAVVERGPDWNVLQKPTVENGTNRVHRYTELSTGLNFTNGYGQLVPSVEQITILPTGGAVANQGRHQVYFPADIASGVLKVVTPDGRQLQSRPLGVTLDDGSNTVFIGVLTNAVGWLTSSNQVTYRNCFDGIKADLVCTYRRGGFECDLVFRAQPPTPDQFGLDPSFTTLQLVTEFFNTQDPQQIPAASDEWFGLQDETLKFGKMTMGRGKAFATPNSQTPDARTQTPVFKSWLHLQGRTFLVEQVPLAYVADDLDALPLSSQIEKPENKKLKFASCAVIFPASHEFTPDTNKIQIASADFNRHPGVVLDYSEYFESAGNFTCQDGVTYLVRDQYHVGNLTIEGGAIIKYWDYESITCDNLVCPASPAHPAVLTSSADNSVGEQLPPEDCGILNPCYTYLYLGGWDTFTVSNIDFYYAGAALASVNYGLDIWNCRFINCNVGIIDTDVSGGSSLGLHNVLFGNCYNAVSFDAMTTAITAEQMTADVQNLIDPLIDPYSYPCSIVLTNCVILTSIDPGETDTNTVYSDNQTCLMNLCSDVSLDAVYFVGNECPWKTGGPGDDYYLVPDSSCYYCVNLHDLGDAAINPDVLAQIQTMTTYAPQDGSMPDTNQPDLGYHYPVNEDADHDGLPDWWEWHWFGSFAHSATDLDASGNTLLSDYQSYANGTPSDPNVIQFSIVATNNYFKGSGHLQLIANAGQPFYYAVLVDSTNFAAANWEQIPYWYNATNFNVNVALDSEGWHEVWVGLRGLPAEATPTWNYKRLKRDASPPQLVITSPANNIVNVPMIQLKGYSSKNLLSISYDLNNAIGLITNQDAGITERNYDAAAHDLTTNYFECLDVPLTNGVNVITLHATDLSGNVTITNFNFTLDYSSKTNPPAVQVVWPPNGALICGNVFTCRGMLGDPTAAISATIVDTNGNTNIVSGLVERDGKFWLEDLPLASGANYLTLTAVDVANNTTITNITVTQSSLVMTIDPISDTSQLWQPTITLTGKISDSTYAVWANGKKGTNYGDHWEVDNVPINAGGTASFVVTAYSPDEIQPDGSQGNGN